MEELLAIWAMGSITAVGVWLLRSLSRHWDRKHQRLLGGAAGGEVADRLADLEGQVHAVARALEDRMTEIEERQDFSERLLTQAARDQSPDGRR